VEIYSPWRLRRRLSVDSVNAADEYQRAGWLIRQVPGGAPRLGFRWSGRLGVRVQV